MIVKVQVPLTSSEQNPPALVYNQSRTYEGFVPVTNELLKAMDGELKKYFHARVDGKGMCHLGKEVQNQWW